MVFCVVMVPVSLLWERSRASVTPGGVYGADREVYPKLGRRPAPHVPRSPNQAARARPSPVHRGGDAPTLPDGRNPLEDFSPVFVSVDREMHPSCAPRCTYQSWHPGGDLVAVEHAGAYGLRDGSARTALDGGSQGETCVASLPTPHAAVETVTLRGAGRSRADRSGPHRGMAERGSRQAGGDRRLRARRGPGRWRSVRSPTWRGDRGQPRRGGR